MWLFFGALHLIASAQPIQQAQIDQFGQNEEGTIPWSNDCLTFESFIGPIDSSSMDAAHSRIGAQLYIEASNDIKTIHIAVTATFYPDSSWMKVRDKWLLNHEQGHFDLCEVYARRIRREISKITSTDYYAVSQSVVHIYNMFRNQEADAHQKYDAETEYGVNHAAQERWSKLIDTQLRESDRYVNVLFSLPITISR